MTEILHDDTSTSDMMIAYFNDYFETKRNQMTTLPRMLDTLRLGEIASITNVRKIAAIGDKWRVTGINKDGKEIIVSGLITEDQADDCVYMLADITRMDEAKTTLLDALDLIDNSIATIGDFGWATDGVFDISVYPLEDEEVLIDVAEDLGFKPLRFATFTDMIYHFKIGMARALARLNGYDISQGNSDDEECGDSCCGEECETHIEILDEIDMDPDTVVFAMAVDLSEENLNEVTEKIVSILGKNMPEFCGFKPGEIFSVGGGTREGKSVFDQSRENPDSEAIEIKDGKITMFKADGTIDVIELSKKSDPELTRSETELHFEEIIRFLRDFQQ